MLGVQEQGLTIYTYCENYGNIFCHEIKGINESARLNKILGKSPVSPVGMLKLPTGAWTETPAEALQLLLETHFPGCTQLDSNEKSSGTVPVQTRWVPVRDWDLAERVVAETGLKWAIRSMKSLGDDAIFPALLQRGLKYLTTPICHIFRASLVIGYIPKAWQVARVAFVPKPGHLDYSQAKAFRPISLTPFLLKGMEKLVDRYLQDESLAMLPLLPCQHAFQAGKSTESALHQVFERIERAIDNKQLREHSIMLHHWPLKWHSMNGP
jgi:hypothetical protein